MQEAEKTLGISLHYQIILNFEEVPFLVNEGPIHFYFLNNFISIQLNYNPLFPYSIKI